MEYHANGIDDISRLQGYTDFYMKMVAQKMSESTEIGDQYLHAAESGNTELMQKIKTLKNQVHDEFRHAGVSDEIAALVWTEAMQRSNEKRRDH